MDASNSKILFASFKMINCSLNRSCKKHGNNFISFFICYMAYFKQKKLTWATTVEMSRLFNCRSVCTQSASCKSKSILPRKMLRPGSSFSAIFNSSLQRLIFRLNSVSPISRRENRGNASPIALD